MGIDIHALRLLQYAASKSPLGDVATLGRQSVHLSQSEIKNALNADAEFNYGPFCEDLLVQKFGAISVTSFDASGYENASIIHDMNAPLVHSRQYDTVMDIGTLEHVFNIATALQNVAELCMTGGQIVHLLPANNFNGHGFWQFSAELFFSLYSPSNGFSDTEIYVVQLNDEQHWWKAATPANGVRVEFTSTERAYIAVLTRKNNSVTSQNVQQSDYVLNWDQGSVVNQDDRKGIRHLIHAGLKHLPYLWRLADLTVPLTDNHRDAWVHRFGPSNANYTKVPLAKLLPPTIQPARRS